MKSKVLLAHVRPFSSGQSKHPTHARVPDIGATAHPRHNTVPLIAEVQSRVEGRGCSLSDTNPSIPAPYPSLHRPPPCVVADQNVELLRRDLILHLACIHGRISGVIKRSVPSLDAFRLNRRPCLRNISCVVSARSRCIPQLKQSQIT